MLLFIGFASNDWGDEFNRSKDREFELNMIKSEEFKNSYEKHGAKLASFRDLSHSYFEQTFNVLICGDLSPASGNLIQCVRVKKSIESMPNVRVFLGNINILEEETGLEGFIDDMEGLLLDKRINLVLCVNVWKNARIFKKIFDKTQISLDIPYILIIAGTDANVAIKVKKNIKIAYFEHKFIAPRKKGDHIRFRAFGLQFSLLNRPHEGHLRGGDPRVTSNQDHFQQC